MRSISSPTPATPARRTRRRTTVVATAAAFGLIATAGFAAATPLSEASASGPETRFALASFTTTIEPVATVTETGTDEIATDVRDALADADATITAADTVEKNVKASGLTIRKTDTTIDTDALERAMTRLESARDLPAPLVPDLTDDVTALVDSVSTHVGDLKKALDKAEKRQAQKEAAEKAKRKAAKAAAEKEAAAAAAAASAPASAPAAPAPASTSGGGNSPAAAQATARSMGASRYGWGDGQFSCLVSLWNKESGWNYQAYNASSGAFGIPQALPGSKMASAGADWQSSASTQISWGLGYISGRYGSPCNAWSHSQSVGWY